jgi:hypothetical protein
MKESKELQKRLLKERVMGRGRIAKVIIKERVAKSLEARSNEALKHLPKPPTDPLELKKIADELEEYFKNPINMEFNSFALSKGWNPYRFKKAAEHSEYLAEKMVIAREMISMRLERGARERVIDMTFIKEFLPKYSQEYKEQRMELATKAGEMNRQQAITVVVPPFPNSDIVPERKDI